MSTTIETLLRDFNARLADLKASLEDGSIEHAVDVGSALAAITKAADTLQNEIKIALRERAVQDLSAGFLGDVG